MKRVLLISAIVCLAACDKKADDQAAKSEPKADKPKAEEPKAEEPKAEEPKAEEPKEAPMVDHDLAAFGKQFEGWIVTAPEGAKIEFDDPSRQIVLSDEDFVTIEEAPYWEDGVKALEGDKDNQNIKQVSPTEVRWERTPPLGKSWLVDVQVTLGEEKWSCGTGMTGTFTSEAMADQIATICKSIRKK